MAHVKHIVQYLMLVGLPFLGLLGVLRIGRDMEAPMAVHGRYAVATVAGPGGPCLRSLLADSSLTITQSGDRVQVLLAGGAVRLSGQLLGDRMAAEGALPATPSCPAGEAVRFEAMAVRSAREMRLGAQLRAECAACGTITAEVARPRRAPASGH